MIIRPIADGTRLRTDHTTYAEVIASYNSGANVEGDTIWVAQADGDQVKAGDKWLLCTKINSKPVNGWMAIIHLGKVICTEQGDFPRLGRTKHRFEMDGKSILEWNGWRMITADEEQAEKEAGHPISIPSVIKGSVLGQDSHCVIPCQWQRFFMQVIVKHIRHQMPINTTPKELYGRAIKVFMSGLRGNAFLTNGKGTNTQNNCITNTFPDREMIAMEPIFTGGNTVLLLDEHRRITGGHDSYPVRCFSSTATPPYIGTLDIYKDPRIQWLTLETRIFVEPNRREIRQGGQAGMYKFPYFILGENSDVAWIPFDRIA